MVERDELPVGGEERLDPGDAYLEEVFLRLRILEGVPTAWIDDDRAEPFVRSGLLLDSGGSLVPTERGMLLLNELVLGLTCERPVTVERLNPPGAPPSPAEGRASGAPR
jgi:coproporphyrinogen III oxidase-like Fe-S oxidoreductase